MIAFITLVVGFICGLITYHVYMMTPKSRARDLEVDHTYMWGHFQTIRTISGMNSNGGNAFRRLRQIREVADRAIANARVQR